MSARPIINHNFPTDTLSTAFLSTTTPSTADSMLADVSFTFVAAAFTLFTVIYLAAVFTFKRYPALGLHNGADPYKAASRITAITHSTCLLPFVITRLLTLTPHFPYLATNTPLDVAVMGWSFAYFTQDILHFLIIEPNDTTLLLHHIVCILFYASVHTAQCGGTAMLAAVVMGEVTNPLQCVWYLAKLSGNVWWYGVLSSVFTVCFVCVRVLVVPVWVVDIVWCYMRAWHKGELNVWYAFGWSMMSVVMMVGSWVWSWQLLTGYLKMRNKRGRVTAGEKRTVGGDEFVSVAGASSKYE